MANHNHEWSQTARVAEGRTPGGRSDQIPADVAQVPPAGPKSGRVTFGMLGPLEARRDGALVDLGPPKQKAVVAGLLIFVNQVVSLDRLTEMLWGADVPARAHGSIQAYIHNLRKVLEPKRSARSTAQVLVTQSPGYLLHADVDALDASRFELLASEGRRLLVQAQPLAAKDRLSRALALWRGQALAEFAFDHFAQPEADRLEQVRANVREDLLEAELGLGNHSAVIGDLIVAVGEHPLRERLWGLLMLALYRSGRQGDALRAFAKARHRLAEELGIDPSPALRSLEAAILAQSPELDFYRPGGWTSALPAAPSGEALPLGDGSLITPVVGREYELRQLARAATQAHRGRGGVVLLSGEAGIGKTRLAKELSSDAEERGALVAWGRAYERPGAPLYWPWLQVIAGLARRAEPGRLQKALAGRRQLLAPLITGTDMATDPGARHLGPPCSAGPSAASPAERFALFEAAAQFLIRLAEDDDVVVVVEDLQWADDASLRLLEHLASRVESSNVLLVATCRKPDEMLAGPLTDTLGALVRLSAFDWIELDGLSVAEVDRLLTQAGARTAPANAAQIHSRTEGNPFFVLHFARLLVRAAANHSTAGDPTLADARLADPDLKDPNLKDPNLKDPNLKDIVPTTVKVAIHHDLAGLSAATRDLLVMAAAMGREFDAVRLATAAGSGVDTVFGLLSAAARRGIVWELDARPGMFRFTHGLVVDTLRGQVSGLRRCTLHELATRAAPERDTPGATRSSPSGCSAPT